MLLILDTSQHSRPIVIRYENEFFCVYVFNHGIYELLKSVILEVDKIRAMNKLGGAKTKDCQLSK